MCEARASGYVTKALMASGVNGKFSHRQRKVYEIVLKANQEVAAQAKPGMKIRFIHVSMELAHLLYIRELEEMKQLEQSLNNSF